MNKTKIIIDTNVFMTIAEFKIDVLSELERACDFPYFVAVLEGTVEELEKIKTEQPLKHKRIAQLALALIKGQKITIIPEKGNVDEALIKHSIQGEIVLTQDRELQQKLQKPYMIIRQKKKIVIIT